jgi:hypothetical protein
MGEEQALAVLRQILDRPEYQRDSTAQPWFDQILGPLADLIGYALANMRDSISNVMSGREGVYGWVILVLCGLLFGAGLVYIARAVRMSVTREIQFHGASLIERRERSERLWVTAQRLAASGALGEAARVLYLSALYALDERALLRIEGGLTNREHAQQLKRLYPEVSPTFSEVVARYDRLRYGTAPVSETAFSELSALVAQSRAAALRSHPS